LVKAERARANVESGDQQIQIEGVPPMAV